MNFAQHTWSTPVPIENVILTFAAEAWVAKTIEVNENDRATNPARYLAFLLFTIDTPFREELLH